MEIAKTLEESDAMKSRYDYATQDAQNRGCDSIVAQFEGEIVDRSCAVINRSISNLDWLAESDRNVYPTYYQQRDAGIKIPEGDKWDALRGPVDEALYQHQKAKIRFASLSLDGVGVLNYGEFSLVLRKEMIEYRAIVFEGNTVKFLDAHPMGKAHEIPLGFRAPWEDRSKVCVAKLAEFIDSGVKSSDFDSLLLKQGATTEDDEFVEVHIWGPITIRTIEKVIIAKVKMRPGDKSRMAKIRNDLANYAVEYEE